MITHLWHHLKRSPLLTGLILMFLLTWPLDLALAAQSHGLLPFAIPAPLGLFVGYGFVAATLIMTGVVEGKAGIGALLRRFLIWRAGIGWYAVVLVGPVAVDLLAIWLHVALGGTQPDFTMPYARQLAGPAINLWLFAAIFFLMDVFTNGEEIGWRGYALPRLQARSSALLASIILGVIWAGWHLPKFLGAGVSLSYPAPVFVLDMIAQAILYTWIFNNTRGSLLLVTLFHSAKNAADVSLPVMPAATGDIRPFMLAIVLRCVLALIVVVVAKPAHLTRHPSPSMTPIPAAS